MARKPETVFKDRIRPQLDTLPNSWFVKIQQQTIRGTPDFIGCVNGHFVALELKHGIGAPIDALQNYMLLRIHNANGISFVVTPESWEDIYSYLEVLATMPFKSKSQMKKLAMLVEQGKMKKSTFDEFKNSTKDINSLPDRITPKKVTGVDRIRMALKTKKI